MVRPRLGPRGQRAGAGLDRLVCVPLRDPDVPRRGELLGRAGGRAAGAGHPPGLLPRPDGALCPSPRPAARHAIGHFVFRGARAWPPGRRSAPACGPRAEPARLGVVDAHLRRRPGRGERRQLGHPLVVSVRGRPVVAGRPWSGQERRPGGGQLGGGLRLRLPDPDLDGRHDLHDRRQRRRAPAPASRSRALPSAPPATSGSSRTRAARRTGSHSGTSGCSGPRRPPDTDPPDTAISSGPSGTTSSTSASFDFSADESASTFECRIDGGASTTCTSPKAYSSLSAASHTFEVRAIDPAGNVDPTPATRSWTIDAPAASGDLALNRPASASSTDPSAGAPRRGKRRRLGHALVVHVRRQPVVAG